MHHEDRDSLQTCSSSYNQMHFKSMLCLAMPSLVLPVLQITCWIGLLWNLLPRVKKQSGDLKLALLGLLFICLTTAILSSSNMSVSCQFEKFLNLFKGLQFFVFINFRDSAILESNQQGLSTNADINNQTIFPPIWVISIILWLINMQIWEIWHWTSW